MVIHRSIVSSSWSSQNAASDLPVISPEDSVGCDCPRSVEQFSHFASLDARVSRKFDLGRGTITAFFEVSNLLDRNNVCCIDYDLETDENDEEFLEYSPDYWLPLLPAIGFLWEF